MDPIIMPQLGENITTGTVVRWHKREGDAVRPGDVLLTVESEKASFDVEAECPGVLLQILHREGQEVTVFSPVGYIGEAGEAPPGEARAGTSPGGGVPAGYERATAAGSGGATDAAHAEDLTRVRRPAGGLRGSGKPFASPSARRVAGEMGINLDGLPGSGPGGRIIKKDVVRAAAADRGTAGARSAGATRAGADDTVIPLQGVRRIAAERLSLSSRTIPHFYLFQDVDMEAALAFREEASRREGVHVTVTALVAHAAVGALKVIPGLNAHVEDTRVTLKGRVHLGIAVSSDRGLVVPVVARADGMDLRTLAEAIGRAVAAARQGRLDPAERGSFTLTSLGMFGVPAFLPLINPPECAILGVGAVQERPSVWGGRIAARPVMTVVLGCDHRGTDGAEAAHYLAELKRRLENGPDLPGS